MLNRKVKKYLDSLEKELKVLESPSGEHLIARHVTDILEQEGDYKPTKEDTAEFIAFDFVVYHQNVGGQKTYYGPMFSFTYEDKKEYVPPSIKAIDQNMLEYWEKKARESKNPILSSRYADLVVYFTSKVLNKSADIGLFHIVIDSNITICEQLLAVPFDCKTKAKRALVLAITIKDKKRIAKIKDTIIKLEKNIARDDIPNLWGFALRWLLLDHSNKVAIEDNEARELVSEAEERLKRVAADPLLTKDTAHLLAEYYKSKKDEENLMRVLKFSENTLKSCEQSNSDALSKLSNYQHMQNLYKIYASNFPKAEKANRRLLQEIGQLDLDYDKSWAKSSFEIKNNKKIIDDFLKLIFNEDENVKLEIVMFRIAFSHLPMKATIEDELKDDSKNNPLLYLIPHGILSSDRVPVAKLPSIDDDYCNHLKFFASRYLMLSHFGRFLRFTMDELRKRFTKEIIINYFKKSMVFKNENTDYLERAISAYWYDDYLVSSHLFIPLIETGFWQLVRICGAGLVWKPNNLNGYDRRSLGALLSDEEIEKAFDENTFFYFKSTLTEKLGFNLRNNFAHGIEKENFFQRDPSDRLFHILISLSLAKKENGKIVFGFS